ncbi:putative amino acid transporter, transmembrane domain-containing protein [Helianthus debilis subsp. tardiflorus]
MDMDPSVRSYPDIGFRAFGKTGRIIVLIIMNIELYLVSTAFLIIEGDNLSNMFPHVHLDIHGLHISGKRCFVMMVAAFILPTTWLNNMKILSYISATGVLDSFIILGSVVWVGKFDGVGFHEKGQLINWNGLPTAVSFYAFCFGAHPVFPTLYASMKKKQQFAQVFVSAHHIRSFLLH